MPIPPTKIVVFADIGKFMGKNVHIPFSAQSPLSKFL